MSAIPPIVAELPLRAFDAGETIIEQGSQSDFLFFLASGRVEVLKDGASIAHVAEVGAVFGEMSVLLSAPHTATVRAVAPSSFHVVRATFDFLHDNPGVALYVAEILARRLDALNRYLVDVKAQFKDHDDHINMLDEVLDALMSKHPRAIERRPMDDDDVQPRR